MHEWTRLFEALTQGIRPGPSPLRAIVRRVLEQGAARGVYPGGVIGVATNGELIALEAVGHYHVDATREVPVTPSSVFDVASLTKVAATWLLAGVLVRTHGLSLDRTLESVFPEYPSPFSGVVTLRMLMTYTAGLPSDTRLDRYGTRERAEIAAALLAHPLETPVASEVKYSNRHLILLGEALSRLAGVPLDVAVAAPWQRLGMESTMFRPPQPLAATAVTTEFDSETQNYLRGIVHDRNARLLEGVAGHAGVFTTAGDLLRFGACVLANGVDQYGEPLIPPPFIAESLKNNTNAYDRPRGLVWNLEEYALAPGTLMPFHDGFTGTAIVLLPERRTVVVLLTNAVQYRRNTAPMKTFRHHLLDNVIAFLS